MDKGAGVYLTTFDG